jgi:hypothetical protein
MRAIDAAAVTLAAAGIVVMVAVVMAAYRADPESWRCLPLAVRSGCGGEDWRGGFARSAPSHTRFGFC